MSTTNRKSRARRQYHCQAASDTVHKLCNEADLRGVSHRDVAVSIAVALAATHPTLAGEVLQKCIMALHGLPVTKIVEAPKPSTILAPDGTRAN